MTPEQQLEELKKRFPHMSGFGQGILLNAQALGGVMSFAGALPIGPWIQIIQLLSGWVVQILSGCNPPAPTPAQGLQKWATDPRPLHRMYIRSNARRVWRSEGGFLKDHVGIAVDRHARGLTLPTAQGVVAEQPHLALLLKIHSIVPTSAEQPKVLQVEMKCGTYVMELICAGGKQYTVAFEDSPEYLPRTEVVCNGKKVTSIGQFLDWYQDVTYSSGCSRTVELECVDDSRVNSQGIATKIVMVRK